MFNMLGVRLDPKLDRLLAAEAKRRRTTKSQLAREAIERYVLRHDLTEQARAQSVLASTRDDDHFPHDDEGWTP